MKLLRPVGSAVARLVPFERVIRAQTQLARIDRVRRRLDRPGLESLDRFLAAMGIREPSEIEKAHREQYLKRWAIRSRRRFMTLPVERQACWLTLAPDVEATLRRGALLVGTHFGCAFLTGLALSRLGIDILFIFRNANASGLLPACIRTLNLIDVPSFQATLEALKTLRRGGVVFLAGDLAATSPDREVMATVLGQRRRLVRGFIDLSIASSIPPTPIFSRMEQDGTIVTWVEPPLVTSASADRETRIAELAQAYADRMSAVFTRFPGNMAPPSMNRYLAGGES